MSRVGAPARIVVLGTPMTLGLARVDPGRVPGVAGLPRALRAAGLAAALDAIDLGDLPAPADYRHERDPRTGVRNLPPVLAHARRIAVALGDALARGDVPLLLGGDCSVLLGALLALRRRGRCGLLHLDGHTDFYPPEFSASGQVAAMELWIATGGSPGGQAGFDGLAPLVAPRDAVLVGHRDHAERARSGAPDPADHLLLALPCEQVRRDGAAALAARAVAALAARGVDGFWLHFDADVLDDRVLPAVDTREPGGLSHAEVAAFLRAATASGRLRGLSLTIFDPSLDPTGSMARDLVATLAAGLRPPV
jgi:arginase